MIKLSDYVLHRVAQEGVRHVFLVPGGAAMHLDDSLAGQRDVSFVANLHEHASAVGAEAYAKLTGNLGVALVTAGPGSTNCLTGLTSAWVNSAPVLFISGQVKRSDRKGERPLRQLGLQEVDMVSIVRSVTKYAVTVTDPSSIRRNVDLALYHARHGRPGPVWLDIPLDVQSAQIDPETLLPADVSQSTPAAADDVVRAVGKVIEELNRAERPILLLGAGIRIAGAADLAAEFINCLRVPYATTWVGIDLVDDHHPCFAGRPGAFAPRGANFAVQNSDLLLSIGARWDFATTGFSHAGFARAARRVVVDVDPAELDKLRSVVDSCILADAKMFLTEMLRQLPARFDDHGHSSWREKVQDWRKRYPVVTPDLRRPPAGISTYVFVEALAERLGPQDIVVQGSAGIHSEIFFMTFVTKAGQRIIADGSLGAMGYGVPAAIGACLGGHGRRTVLMDGDGSLMPNVQELEVIRRLGLPIKIMVINNNGYGSIRVSQSRWFKRKIAADPASGLTLPDLSRIADAFQLPYYRIASDADLSTLLDRALSADGPALIDILVPPEEDRIPRLANYQKADGTMASKPLEDLFPFLDREEFRKNMLVPIIED
ncbi:MAG: thiamine pyrophosphate-binding protein [Kiritimatiellaeota bacterium]|nr:thiamine pyrophosphate-binding protein [Kiritimatiellota bacterium]